MGKQDFWSGDVGGPSGRRAKLHMAKGLGEAGLTGPASGRGRAAIPLRSDFFCDCARKTGFMPSKWTHSSLRNFASGRIANSGRGARHGSSLAWCWSRRWWPRISAVSPLTSDDQRSNGTISGNSPRWQPLPLDSSQPANVESPRCRKICTSVRYGWMRFELSIRIWRVS